MWGSVIEARTRQGERDSQERINIRSEAVSTPHHTPSHLGQGVPLPEPAAIVDGGLPTALELDQLVRLGLALVLEV